MVTKASKPTKKSSASPGINDEDQVSEDLLGDYIGSAARLITQGKHRLYTLTMDSDLLATTCTVDRRDKNPLDGFQRMLDEKRAIEIANYIDNGFGTIPCSIVLSAQPEADLTYISKSQTLRFKKNPRSFLILDGQHRVFGFALANSRLRVPVVIYNNLTRSEEAKLFIDINTKQRPVPNELLLDIRRLADAETDELALMSDVFDLFTNEIQSPLLGQMSPSARQKGKLSRVTFNAALNSIWHVIGNSSHEEVYMALSAYIHAWLQILRKHGAENNITNSTLFRAIILLFPIVADKVNSRHGSEYTADKFVEALHALDAKIKKNNLTSPGSSPVALFEIFKKTIQSGFTLSQSRLA
jgi:DGQHR domain-containing protein